MATVPDDNSLAALHRSIRTEIAYLDSPTDYREFIRPAEPEPLVMLSEVRPPRNEWPTWNSFLWAVLTPLVIYAIVWLIVALLDSQ